MSAATLLPLAAVLVASIGVPIPPPPTRPLRPVNIIRNDDCGSDLDCIYSLEAVYRQGSLGRSKLLALVLDSLSPYGAPVMRTWGGLWRQPRIPIGVYRGATGRRDAASR